MTEPALHDHFLAEFRRRLGFSPDEPLPLTVKTIKRVAALLEITPHKAGDLARRGELPGQLTREEPFVFSIPGLIQALLGHGEPRVDAPDAPAGVFTPFASAGESSNGTREDEPPVNLPWAAGGSEGLR